MREDQSTEAVNLTDRLIGKLQDIIQSNFIQSRHFVSRRFKSSKVFLFC